MSDINTLNVDGTTYAVSSLIKKINIDGSSYDIGTDTSDATATADHILSGKTAYARGFKWTGNIPSISEKNIYPETEDIIIESGKYLSGRLIVKGDSNLLAENIKKGISIFGIEGVLNSSSDIDVLAFGAMNYSGGSPPYQPNLFRYWNGSDYVSSVMNGATITFSGTPILGYATLSYTANSSFCGNPFTTSLTQYTDFKSNSITIGGYSFKTGIFVVIGIK